LPSREEEFYSGTRQKRGVALCPFCGKPDIYPITGKKWGLFRRTVAWSCANEDCRMYRKQFPAPSYGSGWNRT
jgi:hypothetical protein